MLSSHFLSWIYFSCVWLSFCLSFIIGEENTSNGSENTSKSSLFASTKDISVLPSITAIIAIIGGTVICFYGYRLFHFTLYTLSFAFGGLIGYTVIYKAFHTYSWVVTAAWIAFIVLGLLTMSLVRCFYRSAIFLIGAAAGVLLAFFLNTSFLYRISSQHPDTVFYIALIVFAILGGLCTKALEKPAIIVATAIFGSIASIWGLGYFIGKYPSGADLHEYKTQAKNGGELVLPSAWWGYFFATIVFCALGLYVQFHRTGKHSNHHANAIGKDYTAETSV